jgi:hypothetical protein
VEPRRGCSRIAAFHVLQSERRLEHHIELGAREVPTFKHTKSEPARGRRWTGGALVVHVALLSVGDEGDGVEGADGVSSLKAAGDEGPRQVGGAGEMDTEHGREELHRRDVCLASGAGADHAELAGGGRVVSPQAEGGRAAAARKAREARAEAVRLAVVLEEIPSLLAVAERGLPDGDGERGGDADERGVGGPEDGGGEK